MRKKTKGSWIYTKEKKEGKVAWTPGICESYWVVFVDMCTAWIDLAKLEWFKTVCRNMVQVQFLKPILVMTKKVEPSNAISWALVADIIEASETSTINSAHMVIRHQERLLPSHVNKVVIGLVIIVEVITIEYVYIRLERWELFLYKNMLIDSSIQVWLPYPM